MLSILQNFFPPSINKKKPLEPVHIVGNGWASYHFVRNLDKTKYYPIIIAPNSNVLNTTKLIESIDSNQTNLYFGDLSKNNNTTNNIDNNYKWIQDKVVDVDMSKCVIKTESNKLIKYENLVLAIGAETNDFGVKGVNEYSYKIKNKEDIEILRKKLADCVLDTKERSVKIVGAGAVGIELAFKLKNLGFNVELIEGLGEILYGFSDQTIDIVNNRLKLRNIKVIKNSPVTMITDKNIQTKIDSIPYDLVIWTGGVKFNGYEKTKLYNSLCLANKITPRGIIVNDDFSIQSTNTTTNTTNTNSKSKSNTFCLGDIVANKGSPTAQNARNQAVWLANYFNNDFKDNNPYKVKEMGKILHFDNSIYLESKYYTGYLPKTIEPLIDEIHKR